MPQLLLEIRIEAESNTGNEREKLTMADMIEAVGGALNCDGFLESMECVEHGHVSATIVSARDLSYMIPPAGHMTPLDDPA